MANLLYVCDGNRIRSPVAALLTRLAAEKEGYTNLNADSAGLRAIEGKRMTSTMEHILRTSGYESHSHQSKKVTRELLEDQDLILCMNNQQVNEVKDIASGLEIYVRTLPEYAGFTSEEVIDPHNQVLKIPVWLGSRIPESPLEIFCSIFNRISPKDEGAINQAHRETVNVINGYVPLVLSNMEKEFDLQKT